ncbi:hypothetical protein [Microbacterium sp.]|uniref:hypothetical protein n=1 Tax=Microbacterium sp. TaxID=51671 RepID=UPI0039E55F42
MSAPIAAVTGGGIRRWWMLAAVGVAQLMVALDATVVNVALRTEEDDRIAV